MRNRIWLLFATALFTLMRVGHTFVIVVDAHSEECFFETLETGSKMGVTFEVLDGGFLDVDVRVTGPQKELLHEVLRESSSKFAINAHATGRYHICMDNKYSTVTPKEIMFTIEVVNATHGVPGPPREDEAGHTKLREMLGELTDHLIAVKHEQEYMHVRDRMHRAINENTNSRVVLWSIFESILLIAMAGVQIYYLKRFFEVRRIV